MGGEGGGCQMCPGPRPARPTPAAEDRMRILMYVVTPPPPIWVISLLVGGCSRMANNRCGAAPSGAGSLLKPFQILRVHCGGGGGGGRSGTAPPPCLTAGPRFSYRE